MKIAVKKLSASDLTIFRWHFQNRNAGNQKSINLNADVFVEALYPAIEAATKPSGRAAIDLWVYGPSAAKGINLQRKIVKGVGYKNWRLNGEFIANPVEEPTRFDALEPGDYVVFGFEGELAPVGVTAVFLARNEPVDRPIADDLDRLELSGNRTMAMLLDVELMKILSNSGVPNTHPLYALVVSDDLQDAAMGGAAAAERVASRTANRILSAETLRKARDAGEETGQLGEALVAAYLENEKALGRIADYEWTSKKNAISPYDFCVEENDGTATRIDAKSTGGPFERPFHFSFPELIEAGKSAGRYLVYRVYATTETTGSLRISEHLGPLANRIVESMAALPEGVKADSVSIDPAALTFKAAIALGFSE